MMGSVNLNACKSFQPYQMDTKASMLLPPFVFQKMANTSMHLTEVMIPSQSIQSLADGSLELLEIVPSHGKIHVIST